MKTFEQWWDETGSHDAPDASGSTARQAWHAALTESRISMQNTSAALSDWQKVRNGEIPFKNFADKWMPYVMVMLGKSTS